MTTSRRGEVSLLARAFVSLREAWLFVTRYRRPERDRTWRNGGGLTPHGLSVWGADGLARNRLFGGVGVPGSFFSAAACPRWPRLPEGRAGASQGRVAPGVAIPRSRILFRLARAVCLLRFLGFGLGVDFGEGASGSAVAETGDVREGREARAGGGEQAVGFPTASAGTSGEQVPCALPYLEVNVVDRDTGAPLPTARVVTALKELAALHPRGSGRFLLELGPLPRDLVLLCAGAPGYGTEEQIILLDRTKPKTVVRLSLSRGIDVTGRVLGPDGVGVRSAMVALSPERSRILGILGRAETHTDDDGVFVFPRAGAPGREYWVAATAPGLAPYAIRFVCAPEELELALVRRGARVVVRVVDAADGKAVGGARVSTWPQTYQAEDENGSGSGQADESQPGSPEKDWEKLACALQMLESDTPEDGVTEFSLPVGAEISFSAAKPGWDFTCQDSVEIVRPEGQVVVLKLERRGAEETCRVLVRDPSGSPLRVEPIFILLPVGQGGWLVQDESQVAWTDGDGYLVLPWPLEGELGFWSRVGVSEPRALDLREGEELTVAFRAGERAAVRLVDEDGAPVAGVILQMRWVGGGEKFYLNRETGADGFAVFEPLAAGTYVLEDANPVDKCLEDQVIEVVRKEGGSANSYSYRVTRRSGDVVVRGVYVDPVGQVPEPGKVALFVGREAFTWFFFVGPWDEGRFMFRILKSDWEESMRGRPLYLGFLGPGIFGYSFHEFKGVDLKDGGEVFVRLYRKDPGSLSGSIVRSDGSPYRGPLGVLHWPRGAASPDSCFGTYVLASRAETDSRGRFYLRGVPVGLPLCVAVPAKEGEDVDRCGEALSVSERVEVSAGEFRDLGILRVERP